MSETIGIQFPDISGDATTYTAFLRSEEAGTLLNGASGDTIAETGSTGFWTFTLAETRAAATHYCLRIYSGTAETANKLVYDGMLYAGQTLAEKPWNPTQIRGTVGATAPSTTSFTPSALSPAGSTANQFQGRVIVFDNATTTAGLRGQAAEILAASAAALPLLTYTELTTAPVSGDVFSIL